MFKKRIVPEHEETFIVCDYCGKEITDYSYTSSGDEHYHSMYAGGVMGTVEKTCLDFRNEKIKKEYFEKQEKLQKASKDGIQKGFGNNRKMA